MQSERSLKREFLKKWITGLQKCSSTKEKMSLLERKKVIKVSADIAMASTRKKLSSWRHALLSKASRDSETRFLAKRILGSGHEPERGSSITNCNSRREVNMDGIWIKKNNKIKIHVKKSNKKRARAITKRLVKKRTEILKRLVPGGEAMDEYSLIKEALDYIVSLRAQVDVMHHLANSSQLFNYHN